MIYYILKWGLYLAMMISICTTYAQGKQIISKEDEVELPLDSNNKNIYFNFFLNEETYTDRFLKMNIPKYISKYFDTSIYYYIEENNLQIEYYIIYPCVLIDSNISLHKLKNNGFITCNMLISFARNGYFLELSDFYWFNSQKQKFDLSKLFYDYKHKMNLKEKVLYYGALKSTEQLIANTLENYILVIDDLIDRKRVKLQTLPSLSPPITSSTQTKMKIITLDSKATDAPHNMPNGLNPFKSLFE